MIACSACRHQCHALGALLLLFVGVVAAEGEAAAKGDSPSFFSQFRMAEQEDYRAEIAFALFLFLYVLNLILGGRANEALATHWVTEIVRPGNVLDRNFALRGPTRLRRPRQDGHSFLMKIPFYGAP